jgi:hypothetical protein
VKTNDTQDVTETIEITEGVDEEEQIQIEVCVITVTVFITHSNNL